MRHETTEQMLVSALEDPKLTKIWNEELCGLSLEERLAYVWLWHQSGGKPGDVTLGPDELDQMEAFVKESKKLILQGLINMEIFAAWKNQT